MNYKISINIKFYLLFNLFILNDYISSINCDVFKLGYITGSERRLGDRLYQKPGKQISGALTLALLEVNSKKLGKYGHQLEFEIAETYGEENTSIWQTADLWKKGVFGYIGPQETCIHEGRMSAAFNLPMISYFCTHYETSNKRNFPTFARTRPPDTQISKSVVSLLLAFNWTQVTFVYINNGNSELTPIAPTVIKMLKTAGIKILQTETWHEMYMHGYMRNPFEDIVERTYRDTRIYLILGHYYEHIGLMESLHKRELFKKGEYFVVGMDIEQYNPSMPQQYLHGLLQNEPDLSVAEAFRSYLSVMASPPTEFEDFEIQVNKFLESPPFNFPNPLQALGGGKKIRLEAAYLYDAVHLYADALIKILESDGNPKDGQAIIGAIKGKSYKSAMGYLVHIDENGDASGNYTVLGLMEKSDEKRNQTVKGLHSIGTFIATSVEDDTPSQYQQIKLFESVKWVGKGPPIAEPLCGFRGDKCISYTGEITAAIAGTILLILTIVSLVFYRNWRYEQELDSLLWKIDFKDIQMHDQEPSSENGTAPQKLTRTTHPLIRTSQVSLSSNPDADFRYSTIFTPIGLYKGQLYAIKKIKKKSIDITREMKKELKMLRDIRHDNLNAFIGACTEPPNICIITEYCTRGSLKDVLENDDVKLDNMFIASLVFDIIRGMTYLHDSPIRVHGGPLCSSNCLIDSRWVVKLGDFGLHAFKTGGSDCDNGNNNNINEQMEQYEDDLMSIRRGSEESRKLSLKVQKILYIAPELLRTVKGNYTNTLIPGTQKGDVYSFAIVLYEIHTRNGPFGEMEYPLLESLKRLMNPVDPTNPYRPLLQPLETSFDCVRECIKECWTENPEARPDFKSIRTKLRPLRKGMKPNIFDNMMAMMEKYANNLEQLVDERTDQLQEEKKKTEALLLEMLPRPVCEQLKKGHKVEAESYDMVTIYFSDIVGFTSMSAESTPLQVVDFLNDLYTCFDSIIGNYDVYKVETIGDAYMVVSGLPIRNGDLHAAEIASMSLHLLEAIKEFKIRHRPSQSLLLRIGIHSGPVCAGVVGLKMPRYCLFGDTVNTASRMESTGEALKIHCSAECKRLLDRLGGYLYEDRGKVPIKGKGDQYTFWLTGELEDYRLQRAHARTERRASKNNARQIAKFLKEQLEKSSLKDNSLMKKTGKLIPFTNNLTRSSSFDSPKKLRFATGNMLEHHNRYQRYSDDALMEVVSDSASVTNPSRKSNGSVDYGITGCTEFHKMEDLTSSCPCISPTHNVHEIPKKDEKSENVDIDKLQEFQINCTTPLLIQTS